MKLYFEHQNYIKDNIILKIMDENDNLSIFISLILGILFAIIVYKFYLKPTIIRGPNSRDIVDKIFEHNGEYYKLVPVVCGCIKK